MDQKHDVPFKDLYQQIGAYSPASLPILEQMQQDFGSTIAYYAAFVIVCIKAKQESSNSRSKDNPTPDELKTFTFFEVAKNNPAALALFDDLLASYLHEQPTQTNLRRPDLRANPAVQPTSEDTSAGSSS